MTNGILLNIKLYFIFVILTFYMFSYVSSMNPFNPILTDLFFKFLHPSSIFVAKFKVLEFKSHSMHPDINY